MSLYPPPQTQPTRIFTTLPERFSDPHRASEWIDANKPGQQVPSFLEGPTFDRQGNLWVTDIPHGRIFCISPDGDWTLAADYDGWPNGLALHRDGRFFVADYKAGILVMDPDTGDLTPYLTSVMSERLRGVNDLTFDSLGRLYFTDQGQSGIHKPYGRVFRYDPTSKHLQCLLDNCPSPNGLVLDPDEAFLFVAMTRGNAIWRLPVDDSGVTSKVGVFTQMAGGVSGADGLAMAADGTLAVCDAGNGCVWTFSKWGEPLHRYRACIEGRTTTNLAYGVSDASVLYFTESSTGTVLCADTAHTGQVVYGLS